MKAIDKISKLLNLQGYYLDKGFWTNKCELPLYKVCFLFFEEIPQLETCIGVFCIESYSRLHCSRPEAGQIIGLLSSFSADPSD